jgi:hypothetical protein
MPKRTKLIGICFSVILDTTGYSQQQFPTIPQNKVAEMEKVFASAIQSQDTMDRVGRGQNGEQSQVQRVVTRTVSIYTGLGFLELIAFGVQYQINDEYALGVMRMLH